MKIQMDLFETLSTDEQQVEFLLRAKSEPDRKNKMRWTDTFIKQII